MSINILFVEDSDIDFELALFELESQLTEFKYKRVDNEENFRGELFSFKPDTIICDYNLPNFDGESALKIVKESNLEIPFILFTGTLGEEKAVEMLKSGATDFVLKDNVSRLPFAIKRAVKEVKEIVEKKKFFEKLILSEKKFRNLFKYASDEIYILDIENEKILDVNLKVVKNTQFSAEDFINKNIKDTILFDTFKKYKLFVDNKEDILFESYHKRSNGESYPVEITSSFFESEEKDYLLIFARDITDRYQNKKILDQIIEGVSNKTGQDYLQNLSNFLCKTFNINFAFIGTYYKKENSINILASNNDIFKEKNSLLINDTPFYLVIKNGISSIKDNLNNLFSNIEIFKINNIQSFIGIKLVNTKNETIGMLCIMDNKPMIDIDYKIKLLSIFATRISSELERISINNEIVKNKKLLEESQQIANLGSWEWDLNKNKIYWSDEFYRILNLKPKEVIPSYENYLDVIHSNEKNKLKELIQNTLETSNPFVFEHRVVDKEGNSKFIESRGFITSPHNSNFRKFYSTALDITQRKKYEKELEKLSLVASKTENAVFVLDENLKIEWANESFLTLMEMKNNDLENKTIQDILENKNSSEETLYTISKNLLQQKPFTEEIKIHSQSNIFWISLTVTPILNSNNKVEKFIGISTNITKRIVAENALRKSEAKFRVFLESVPDAVIIINLNKEIIFFNSKASQMFGYSKNEVIGKSINKIFPVNLNFFIKGNSILNSYSYCTFCTKKNGLKFPSEVVISPVDFEEEINNILIVRDVSEIKEAEKVKSRFTQKLEQKVKERTDELRFSEEKYRLIANNMKDLICLHDLQGNYTFISSSSKEILGYSPNEILGINAKELIMSDDLPEFDENWIKTTKSIDYYQKMIQYRMKTKKGDYLWVETNISTVFDENKNLIGIQTSTRDISERKKAEENIKAALKKEKELGELKSKFVSMVSHEFRTPLTEILSGAKLLKKNKQKWSEDKQIEYLDDIAEAVERLNEMLSDVIFIGKSEAGKIELRPQKINLKDFCLNMIDRLKISYISFKPNICFNFSGNSDVFLDQKLLQHILINILSNAVKYSPEMSPVEFDVNCSDDTITFKISDKGIGISEADQKKLFEEFHRAENVRDIPGTGLGLAIVKRSLNTCNGSIEVKSNLNEGTTFIVKIPSHIGLFENE